MDVEGHIGVFYGQLCGGVIIEKSMGPLWMIPHVWHDKDGAMDSVLWKLWASSMRDGGHVGSDSQQSLLFKLIRRPLLALKVPMDGHF